MLRSAALQLAFEAMTRRRFNATTFTLVKQGSTTPVAATVTYNAPLSRPSCDPAADLDPATTYTATVKGGSAGAKDPLATRWPPTKSGPS